MAAKTGSLIGTNTPSPRNRLHRTGLAHSISVHTATALAFFVLYGALGFYLTFHLHYYAGDAASRVGNAYYVLFSRNPHLGAIGFIWNPLPSLLELPFVALYPLIPSMVTHVLAGVLVSAILAAWGIANFGRILDNFGVPRPWQTIIVILYGLNPLILLYSANGMSDIMLISCVLGAYSGLFDYIQTHSLARLAAAGFWMAAALGMRYEAVPFAAFVILGFAAGQWGKVSSAQWKGGAIILGAPIVVSGGLWLYFNWLIMKSPLYFLLSNYGNVAQTATGAYFTHATTMAEHSFGGSMVYIGHFMAFFWPIVPALLLTVGSSFGKYRDSRAPILVGGTLGLVSMELVGVYLGHLGQWDRYFISYIPNGLLMLAFIASRFSQRMTSFKPYILWPLACIVTLSGNVGTIAAVQSRTLGHSDGSIIDMAWRTHSLKYVSNPFTKDLPVIRYIDQHPRMLVVADSFEDWPIIVRSRNAHQFIITSDYDFNSVLNNPRGQVTDMLVPKPQGVAKLDAINVQWPTLWAGKLPWTKLVKSFPGGNNYRLYKVTSSAP